MASLTRDTAHTHEAQRQHGTRSYIPHAHPWDRQTKYHGTKCVLRLQMEENALCLFVVP